MRARTLLSLMVLLAGTASASLGQARSENDGGKGVYAVVFLNRGHVTGGAQSNIGLFRRFPGDSVWTNIYKKNLLSFGMGIWKGKSGDRYYLAAGNGLHRSTDGTRSWRVLTDWHTEEALSVALDPVDSAVIYIGTPFGVFKSTDDGRSWKRTMKGMKKWFVKKVLIDRGDRQTLYAAAEDDVYRSTNGGEDWSPLHTGFTDIQAIAQSPVSSEHLFAGAEYDGVRMTTDGGKTWIMPTGLPKESFYAIAIAPDGKTVYAGGFKTGVWTSNDAGKSWHQLWQNTEIEAVYAISVDTKNPRYIIIGTSGQGVYESSDAGAMWRHAGLWGCQVRQIVLND